MSPVEVAKHCDAQGQSVTQQVYTVPCPKYGDSYCAHDQAVYSIWNHFVYFCESESQSLIIRTLQQRQVQALSSPPDMGLRQQDLRQHHNNPDTSYSFHPDRRKLIVSFLNTSLARPHMRVNEFTKRNRLPIFLTLSAGRSVPVVPSTTAGSFLAREVTPSSPHSSISTPTPLAKSVSGDAMDIHWSPSTVVVASPTMNSSVKFMETSHHRPAQPERKQPPSRAPGFAQLSSSLDEEADREISAIHKSAAGCIRLGTVIEDEEGLNLELHHHLTKITASQAKKKQIRDTKASQQSPTIFSWL
jgi:hypothetical protein